MPRQAARALLLPFRDLHEKGPQCVYKSLWLRCVLVGKESNLGATKDKGICYAALIDIFEVPS